MSKILIVLFLLGSFSLKSQIEISILKGSINSKNSDLDFNQIDDTTAFFTSSYFNGSKQVSEIFISKKSNVKFQAMGKIEPWSEALKAAQNKDVDMLSATGVNSDKLKYLNPF